MVVRNSWVVAIASCAFAGCVLRPTLAVQTAHIRAMDRERGESLHRGRHVSDDLTYSRQLLAAYDLYAPAIARSRLKTLGDDDLKSAFGATSLVAFYSMEAAPASGMADIFDEMTARGIATAKDAADVYDQDVVARLFDRARAVVQAWPGLKVRPLPAIVEPAGAVAAGGARAYGVAPDGGAATLSVPLASWDKGPKVVISADPDCSPSNALAGIASDAELREVLQRDAVLLAAPEALLEAPSIAQWNRRYPVLTTYVAYRAADWPAVDLGTTPVFNLFKDGKLVSRVYGYRPYEQKRAELIDKLRAIGIDVPSVSGINPGSRPTPSR